MIVGLITVTGFLVCRLDLIACHFSESGVQGLPKPDPVVLTLTASERACIPFCLVFVTDWVTELSMTWGLHGPVVDTASASLLSISSEVDLVLELIVLRLGLPALGMRESEDTRFTLLCVVFSQSLSAYLR
ncbi:unnamed protein product, partial [Heterobilharzia americana]